MTRTPNTSRPSDAQAPRALRLSGFAASLLTILAVLAPTLAAQQGPPEGPVYAADTASSEVSSDGTFYSYVYALDGSATLYASQSDAEHEIEANLPVLEGDRVWTHQGSRMSLFLSDGSLLSTDGNTDVVIQNVVGSPDSSSQETVIKLLSGRLLLHVESNDYGMPLIDTANARVYLQSTGVYVVSANEEDWTHVIAREGFAEVVDQRGSSIVREGEEIEVDGTRRPNTQVSEASRITSLENWAVDQASTARLASDPGLEEPIHNTADLEDHGDWLQVEGTRAWRPTVESNWRPYWHGRWRHTPRGLYWASSDPWGSSVYQYGSWDYNNRHGWLWYPGYNYAPSHVYWYWGPSYTAWVPSGYYTRHYRSRFGGRYGGGFGFRFGHYGWAGGSWDPFNYWNFCPTRYFGYRGQGRYLDYGRRLRRRGALERGFITTDTRRITPDRWNRHDLVRRTFDEDVRRNGRGRTADLPQVDDFLARRELNDSLRKQVLVTDNSTPRLRNRRPVNAADTLATPRSGTRSATPRRATPTPNRGVTAKRSGGLEAARGTTPRSRTDARGRNNGSTARRVLDGVRGRTPDARGASPRTATPRATSPRSRTAVPQARTRPQASPRSATPRRSTPRSATPRATTPRSATPRSATPRSTSPRSATPRSASPRSGTPRATPRATPRTTPRATPRASQPRTRSASPPTARPRSASPRSASPRATSPRSTTPRASRPRATPPPRSGSASRPQATPRTRSQSPRVRSSAPRASQPRASQPRASQPRATAPRTRTSSPRATPRSTPPRSSTRTAPRSSRPRASQPRASAPRRQAPPTARRSTTNARPSTRRAAPSRRSTPAARSAPRSSAPRSSARPSSRPSARSSAKSSSSGSRRARPAPRKPPVR